MGDHRSVGGHTGSRGGLAAPEVFLGMRQVSMPRSDTSFSLQGTLADIPAAPRPQGQAWAEPTSPTLLETTKGQGPVWTAALTQTPR